MADLYIDATIPLRWGPHPLTGIPRVESAIVRQALRQDRWSVKLFRVDRSGEGHLLSDAERRYVERLVEGRITTIDSPGPDSYWARLSNIAQTLRDASGATGREFDRVAAIYLSRRPNRSGLRYHLAKTLIRLIKLGTKKHSPAAPEPFDPLSDPEATCFLSTSGLHNIALRRNSDTVKAKISTVLHDLIAIDYPDLVERGQVQNVQRSFDWMRKHCRQIVAVSHYTAQRALAHIEKGRHRDAPPVAANPLGSFLKATIGGRASVPVDGLSGRDFAIYCATIEIRKNHITLLKAWQRLIPVLGKKMPVLVICGRWGWMVEEVTEFLDAHPEIRDHVRFVSDVSDLQLAWLYENARFGLYPAFVEGWGLGAAECLDFGLPVVISDAASLAEATQGLMPIVPAEDVEGWSEAVLRASVDPQWLASLRASIARDYRPRLETAFSDRLLQLMGSLAEGSAVEMEPEFERRGSSGWRPTEVVMKKVAFG